MRAYARGKVASERLLAGRDKQVRYVILRPTVVRRPQDIRELAEWSLPRKLILAGRYTHTVAVEDVVHSILWFLQDTLDRENHPVGLEIYNVADERAEDTYAGFFKTALALTQDPRYRCPPHAPAIVDRLMNWYKYRTLEPRWPFGLVTYSSEKLFHIGYRHSLGIAAAYQNALLNA
jgi:nucleoside-diphosphate-sugar epimerase